MDQLFGQPAGRGIALARSSVDVDGPDLPPHRRMFEWCVGNQGDLLAWRGVAKATTQRFALAGGGERTELVAVGVFAGGADDVEPGGIDRVHEQSVRVVGGHAVPSLFVATGARIKPPNGTPRHWGL